MTLRFTKKPQEVFLGILKVFNWVSKRNLIKLNNVRSRPSPYCLHRCGLLIYSPRTVSFQGCCGTKPSPSGKILWRLYCSSYVSPLVHNTYWMVTFIAKMWSIDFLNQWLQHPLHSFSIEIESYHKTWQYCQFITHLKSFESDRHKANKAQLLNHLWHRAGLKSSQAIHSVVRIDKSRFGFQLQQLNRTSTGLHSAHNLISTQDTHGGLWGIVGGWRVRTWVNWML